MSKQKGFTLIELLVVVSIISLLASIILSSVNSARAKGRDAARKENLVQLQNALELYYNANGNYPAVGNWSGYQTVACGITGTLSGAGGYIPNLAPTYIGTLPTDPISTTGCWYGLLYRSDGTNYKIIDYLLPDSNPAVGTKFYDPVRGANTFMICNDPAGAYCTTT